MELLPILQAVSTPVLLALGVVHYRSMLSIHAIDKRLAVIETKVSGLRHEVSKIS